MRKPPTYWKLIKASVGENELTHKVLRKHVSQSHPNFQAKYFHAVLGKAITVGKLEKVGRRKYKMCNVTVPKDSVAESSGPHYDQPAMHNSTERCREENSGENDSNNGNTANSYDPDRSETSRGSGIRRRYRIIQLKKGLTGLF
jgi:hypothetical protein